MRKRPIPVSKLADFAADPAAYRKSKGGVRDADAVAHGIAHHDKLGRRFPHFKQIVILLVATISVAAVVLLWHS